MNVFFMIKFRGLLSIHITSCDVPNCHVKDPMTAAPSMIGHNVSVVEVIINGTSHGIKRLCMAAQDR